MEKLATRTKKQLETRKNSLNLALNFDKLIKFFF